MTAATTGFDIEEFHAEAVQTPSHESVDEMRELLVDTLTDAGHSPHVDDDGNVLVSRGVGDVTDEGATASPHIVLNTHIDTVAPHISYEPDGDVVRGRGACDAKGPLAALLAAFLRTEPDEGTLTLAITPDEETTQIGAAALADRLSADGFIVGEPTDLDVCTAARGQCEAEITVSGAGGHAASVPADENPMYLIGHVLTALSAYDDTVGTEADPLLGEPKLTPTVLSGGDTTNRVPDECRLTVDRRSVPPETSDGFRESLQAYLADQLPDRDVAVDLLRADTPFPDPFVTDSDAELVTTLAAASDGDIRAFGAATEASYFAATAPTVVFGPGVLADDEGPVAHASREYVRLSDVRAAADAVETALTTLV
ncbi:M20/M25/M40 family metallo-hydrolase [Halonotius terrestris]|uniref:M20/M25/M40 family metallo-hydrolase n=1 Tax=Halonotius terrestris TaxID=2487750 RepID=A0A8J8PBE4_9EURY|nr:M20/M25/M40 family metallo-hydrolase [Halonotius terrestris]TQQ83504.1 M20/M25/M40 family metallo-hydrolase [Halonotius terrestris]